MTNLHTLRFRLMQKTPSIPEREADKPVLRLNISDYSVHDLYHKIRGKEYKKIGEKIGWREYSWRDLAFKAVPTTRIGKKLLRAAEEAGLI